MKRRRLLLALLLLAGGAVALPWALLSRVDTRLLGRELSESLNLPTTVDAFRFEWNGSLVLLGAHLQDGAGHPLLSVRSARARLSVPDLLRARVRLLGLDLEGPDLSLSPEVLAALARRPKGSGHRSFAITFHSGRISWDQLQIEDVQGQWSQDNQLTLQHADGQVTYAHGEWALRKISLLHLARLLGLQLSLNPADHLDGRIAEGRAHLTVDSFWLKGELELQSLGHGYGVHADKLEVAGQELRDLAIDGEGNQLRQASLRGPWGAVKAHGSLDPAALELELSGPQQLQLTAKGPWEQLQLRASAPHFQLEATLARGIPTRGSWQVLESQGSFHGDPQQGFELLFPRVDLGMLPLPAALRPRLSLRGEFRLSPQGVWSGQLFSDQGSWKTHKVGGLNLQFGPSTAQGELWVDGSKIPLKGQARGSQLEVEAGSTRLTLDGSKQTALVEASLNGRPARLGLAWHAPQLTVDELSWPGLGPLKFSGGYTPHSGQLDLSTHFEGLALEPGKLWGGLKLTGTLSHPEAQLEFELKPLQAGGLKLAELTGQAHWLGDQVELKLEQPLVARGVYSLSGQNLELKLVDQPLANLPQLGARGEVSGVLRHQSDGLTSFRGSLHKLVVHDLVLGGAQVALTSRSGKAHLELAGLSPEGLLKGLRGRLGVQADRSGQTDRILVRLEKANLDGRAWPPVLARLTSRPGEVVLERLTLASRPPVYAQGRLDLKSFTLALQSNLQGAALGPWLPLKGDATGKLQADATVFHQGLTFTGGVRAVSGWGQQLGSGNLHLEYSPWPTQQVRLHGEGFPAAQVSLLSQRYPGLSGLVSFDARDEGQGRTLEARLSGAHQAGAAFPDLSLSSQWDKGALSLNAATSPPLALAGSFNPRTRALDLHGSLLGHQLSDLLQVAGARAAQDLSMTLTGQLALGGTSAVLNLSFQGTAAGLNYRGAALGSGKLQLTANPQLSGLLTLDQPASVGGGLHLPGILERVRMTAVKLGGTLAQPVLTPVVDGL